MKKPKDFLMRDMKDKYKKFYMMFNKRFKNLILCSKTRNDDGIK